MGLKSLLTDLESFDANNNSMDSYGFHDTPASSGGLIMDKVFLYLTIMMQQIIHIFLLDKDL